MDSTVAALMQLRADTRRRTPPDADFGRAAELLEEEGLRVLVAAPEGVELGADQVRVQGFRPTIDGWAPSGPHRLDAVFNRLPSRRSSGDGSLLSALAARGLPLGNPPSLNALALDKARSCELLASAGLPVPETESDPGAFSDRLAAWRVAFLKPRFGSFGDGVRRIDLDRGHHLPEGGPSGVLQRAVPPPQGPFAGVCVRGFLQRRADGRWASAGRVARVSGDDPVANVARGARGIPVADLERELPIAAGIDAELDRLERSLIAAIEAFAGEDAWRVLELGADWVLAQDGSPRLVEINGKPGGRLGILAELPGEEGVYWRGRHRAALTAPFRRLAALAAAT